MPVEFTLNASLPIAVFVAEFPPPRPTLIPFMEISLSKEIALAALKSPAINTLELKDASFWTNRRLFIDTSSCKVDFFSTKRFPFKEES